MSLNYRHGESNANDKITAYPVGAKLEEDSSSSGDSNTYSVHAGHSFRPGDKVLRDPGGDNAFSGTDTVQAATATSIEMGTTVSGSPGDLLVNLGPDTGTGSPAFDGSKMKIFSDPDGATAISDAEVTADANDDYEYYHKGDGKFWELIRKSDDTLVDNCHLDGKGKTFGFGFQVKGGYNNKIINCSIRDVPDTGGSITAKHGFKDRGDAPWKASASTGTYPYSGQGNQWNASDERRASHRTIFMNCVVEGSEFNNDFNSQENTDACFMNCVSKNSGKTAFAVNRTNGTIDGEEANIRLLNCVAENPTLFGFTVQGPATDNLLPNVLLHACRVENAGYNGIYLNNTDRGKIVRCTVRNCADAGHATYKDGIWVRDTNNRPEIIGSESFDDQATATQRYGINISSATTYPRVEGCRCTGNTGNSGSIQIKKDADGIYLNNSTDTDVIKTFDANDATPSVADGEFFKTANTTLTTISDFLDGTVGQKIIVLINDDDTKIDFSAGNLKGAPDPWTPESGDHMTCWYDGTYWYCDLSENTPSSP